MKLKVCVHLDPAEETFTTGAARQEHHQRQGVAARPSFAPLVRRLLNRGGERL